MTQWIGRPILWIPVSLFPHPVLSLPSGLMTKVAMVEGGYAQATWTPLTMTDLTRVTAEFPLCQQQRSTLSLQYGSISGGRSAS